MPNKAIKLNTDDSTTLADDIIKNIGFISQKDKGETTANLAIAYIEMINELNAERIVVLKKGLATLDELNAEEKGLIDQGKVAKIRQELNI
ncbi:MAG: hypothetical protein WCO10_01670 [bacterium]